MSIITRMFGKPDEATIPYSLNSNQNRGQITEYSNIRENCDLAPISSPGIGPSKIMRIRQDQKLPINPLRLAP